MSKVYLLCGIIGSGKSTWASSNKDKLEALIVCQDNIREMLYGDYDYRPELENVVKLISRNAIKELLKHNENIIIDECWETINVETRSELIQFCKSIQPKCEIVCINFNADFDRKHIFDCLQ